jgi:hypothetical protein
VERRNGGESIRPNPRYQRSYAIPHLAGRFIGEGHGQNRPSGHVVGAHQVGDAVGDDAGFAATGAGKDEKRAFGVFHRLALAGIQACEKIHGRLHFSTTA